MLRRLHPDQPDSFAFTPDNLAWAEAEITKFPEGRQASAVIPLLWRAQEQEGWLSRPAMEEVGRMLGMPHIRVLEVATFYFMFHLQPVGSVANIQVCGTTSCMICGAEDLIGVCREKIADRPHELSADGRFSWEEVECLGACANAPMAQIGKDYYEDLTAERLGEIIDALGRGEVPEPGPQTGRYGAEPAGGLTSLKEYEADRPARNASVEAALDLRDTVKRIDGTEVPLRTPWQEGGQAGEAPPRMRDDLMPPSGRSHEPTPGATPGAKHSPDRTGVTKQEAKDVNKGKPDEGEVASGDADAETEAAAGLPDDETVRPAGRAAPRDGGADDLKRIKGVGPKLEAALHAMGIYHFDQIAGWSAAELAWVDRNLEGFKGRVIRDDWVTQARRLPAEGET